MILENGELVRRHIRGTVQMERMAEVFYFQRPGVCCRETAETARRLVANRLEFQWTIEDKKQFTELSKSLRETCCIVSVYGQKLNEIEESLKTLVEKFHPVIPPSRL